MDKPKSSGPIVITHTLINDGSPIRELVRRSIVQKVENAKWDIERAQRVADRLNLGELADRPDPTLFNPMDKATWSLSMAAAWLCWRTPERVHECWEDYRRECYKMTWHQPGWKIQRFEGVSLMELGFMEAFDILESSDAMLMSIKSAREQLWNALAQGSLIATAIKLSTGRPVQVPSHEWPYLSLTGDTDLVDELRFQEVLNGVEYRDVTLARSDLERIWPATAKRPDTKAGASAPAKKRTSQRALKAAVAELIRKNPAASDHDVQELAKSLGANREEVRSEWREAREKVGRPTKVGRPSKK